jgi:hypothetical protein
VRRMVENPTASSTISDGMDDKLTKTTTPPAKRSDSPPKSGKEKLSLYPLTIEEAVRAALKTGRAPPPKPKLANRQRKKRTTPA